MANAHLMQRFVEGELTRSADLIARTLARVREQLRQPRDALLNASEHTHYFDLMQALAQHQALFQQRFIETLRAKVMAETLPAPGLTESPQGTGHGSSNLQLMDESRVETEIELSRAIQLIDSTADWELRELQTFTSTLRGQDHVTAESNPLRPQVYAQALWDAASALPVARVQQVILLRISASVMAELLKMAWAAACTRLEAQGIEPSIYRTVVLSPSIATATPVVNVTQPGALDALRRAMPDSAVTPLSSSVPKAMPSARPETSELEAALAKVEAVLNRLPAAATGETTALRASALLGKAPRLAEHRASLLATTGEMVDRQIIELISRLFETILSDSLLHSPVRHLLARLQVPALRIALRDPSMLDDYSHPVWLLMARLTSVSTSYPFPADRRLLALLSFCETLIDDTVAQVHSDAAIFRTSLARLDAFLNEQLRQQQTEAQATIDALTRTEQSEMLREQLSDRLLDRMATLSLSPAIRHFISGPWARLLAHAMSTFGEKDERTTGYVSAVDELLWSLQVPDHPQSRQRLVNLLPGLLQRLRAGMALMDLPCAEQQEVLDELMKRHAEALRPGGRTAPAASPSRAADSPEEIMRGLREEVMPPVALGATSFSDSLIDLASMDTVPAELMPDGALPARQEPAQWVAKLSPGQRYRMFLNGRWTQTQLLWRSEHGGFFLFAGEAANHTHSITQRALERLREADLVKAMDAHSLIQRAVDNMLRKMDHAL